MLSVVVVQVRRSSHHKHQRSDNNNNLSLASSLQFSLTCNVSNVSAGGALVVIVTNLVD